MAFYTRFEFYIQKNPNFLIFEAKNIGEHGACLIVHLVYIFSIIKRLQKYKWTCLFIAIPVYL